MVSQMMNMGGILCRNREWDTTAAWRVVGESTADDESGLERLGVGVAGSGNGRGWCLVETIFCGDPMRFGLVDSSAGG